MTLLIQANDLVTKGEGGGVKLHQYMMRPWNNAFYLRILVLLWAVADLSVAASHLPNDGLGRYMSAALLLLLLGTNLYLLPGHDPDLMPEVRKRFTVAYLAAARYMKRMVARARSS